MSELLTIEDVAAMTMLSTRTIRSYLAGGQLSGEKVNGAWRFSLEQFEAFLNQDMVRQSVRAKGNGRIYDFLLTQRRKESAACLICDWPVAGGEEESRLRERLMAAVNERGLGCAYQFADGAARAILTGPPAALGTLLTQIG